jgi:hypothetical protein
MSDYKLACIFVLLFSLAVSTYAERADPDYKLLNAIASCQTVMCVSPYENKVQGKLERTVLYAQWALLDPSNREASRGLLSSLPATEDELTALMTLPDWHESATKSQADMFRLSAVYENWPRLLAVAVRRFPKYLPAYIRYGRLAVMDAHSDYTGHEQTVCRSNPKRFVEAFRTLSGDDQHYIRQHVFNPDRCHPIFLSESER